MEVKIKIKIKDVEIELSREDAQELRDILNDLVAKEKKYIPYPYPYPDPVPYPVYPTLPWYRWDVTCGSITSDPLPLREYTISLTNT